MSRLSAPDPYQELRDALRDLSKEFPDEYWRRIDHERVYPEAFVDALTRAGWMAALIPQEYGGSGRARTEAAVIMEEITRSADTSVFCEGQMYNMITLLRLGAEAA